MHICKQNIGTEAFVVKTEDGVGEYPGLWAGVWALDEQILNPGLGYKHHNEIKKHAVSGVGWHILVMSVTREPEAKGFQFPGQQEQFSETLF